MLLSVVKMLIMKFYFFYFLSVFKGEDWYKVMLANLKFQGHEAVKNKDYLSAEEIYTKVLFAFTCSIFPVFFLVYLPSPRF